MPFVPASVNVDVAGPLLGVGDDAADDGAALGDASAEADPEADTDAAGAVEGPTVGVTVGGVELPPHAATRSASRPIVAQRETWPFEPFTTGRIPRFSSSDARWRCILSRNDAGVHRHRARPARTGAMAHHPPNYPASFL
jgi:hypothetical protein